MSSNDNTSNINVLISDSTTNIISIPKDTNIKNKISESKKQAMKRYRDKNKEKLTEYQRQYNSTKRLENKIKKEDEIKNLKKKIEDLELMIKPLIKK